MKNFDKKSFFLLLFIATLAIAAYFFDQKLMAFLRLILEGKHLENVLVLVVCVTLITHAIKVQNKVKSSVFLFRSGHLLFDVALNILTYYSVTSTACSLLEGAYLQNFYNIQYFTRFEGIDINVLLAVCALMLWYVSIHVYKMFEEILFTPSEVKATTEKLPRTQ